MNIFFRYKALKQDLVLVFDVGPAGIGETVKGEVIEYLLGKGLAAAGVNVKKVAVFVSGFQSGPGTVRHRMVFPDHQSVIYIKKQYFSRHASAP